MRNSCIILSKTAKLLTTSPSLIYLIYLRIYDFCYRDQTSPFFFLDIHIRYLLSSTLDFVFPFHFFPIWESETNFLTQDHYFFVCFSCRNKEAGVVTFLTGFYLQTLSCLYKSDLGGKHLQT